MSIIRVTMLCDEPSHSILRQLHASFGIELKDSHQFGCVLTEINTHFRSYIPKKKFPISPISLVLKGMKEVNGIQSLIFEKDLHMLELRNQMAMMYKISDSKWNSFDPYIPLVGNHKNNSTTMKLHSNFARIYQKDI